MKRCDYCGATNEDVSPACCGCGEPLTLAAEQRPQDVSPAGGEGAEPLTQAAAEEESSPDDPAPSPEPVLLDLRNLEGAFLSENFSHPNWPVIDRALEEFSTEADRDAALDEVLGQWMQKLREDLGGEYGLHRSNDFLLLCDRPRELARRLLTFAEDTLSSIREHLADLVWRGGRHKHVVILFSEDDDYYEYVAHFDRAQVLPASRGVHIERDFPHIVVKFETEVNAAQTLAHELTHHCLTHRPIPLWLNEGVAQRLQRVTAGRFAPRSHEGDQAHVWAALSQWKPPLMWAELAEEHHAFWTPDNIQGFWAGTLFDNDGKAQELCYSLAEVLVDLAGANREPFLDFVSRAHFGDAGQTAALDCLGVSLGDLAGNFLGEGNWRPLRKALVECWNSAGPPATDSPRDESGPTDTEPATSQ